jgi:glucose-6-phosphate-specific signal transduction histidine kinase
MDDMLWSIAPENDTMREMILRLQEFVDALHNRYAASITLKVENKLNDLNLEMTVRHEFFLLLKLALRLIVEDCYGKNTHISMDYVRSKIVVKMKDEKALIQTGRPVVNDKIHEMNKRSETIGVELDIQTDSKGLSVIMILPV